MISEENVPNLLSRREMTVTQMCLSSYLDMDDCPEKEQIRTELKEIIRKLMYMATYDIN